MRAIYYATAFLMTFCFLGTVNAHKSPTFVSEQMLKTFTNQYLPNNEVLGQLKLVEDAGYPIVILTIEHADGHVGIYDLNLQDVENVDAKKLNSWVSQEVAFEYLSETQNALLDLRRDGKSIIDAKGIKLKPGTKKVTGILSNAENATAGDLPDELLITTVEEITVPFLYFITRKIVAANGKKVVGYYEERTKHTITAIKLAK